MRIHWTRAQFSSWMGQSGTVRDFTILLEKGVQFKTSKLFISRIFPGYFWIMAGNGELKPRKANYWLSVFLFGTTDTGSTPVPLTDNDGNQGW